MKKVIIFMFLSSILTPALAASPSTATHLNRINHFSLRESNDVSNIEYDQSGFEINGKASHPLKFVATIIYSPSNPNGDSCQFAEDKYSIEGTERHFIQTVETNTEGSYLLSFPIHGIRGKCDYEITEVSLDIMESTDLFQVLSIQNIKNVTMTEKQSGVSLDYSPLTSQDITCDFSNPVMLDCDLNSTLTSNFAKEKIHLNFLSKNI